MPEPISTPVRSRSSSSCGCQPASSTASTRRGDAVDDELVVLAQLLGLDIVVGLELALALAARHHGRAILAGRSSTSNRSIRRMPDSPAISRARSRSTPLAKRRDQAQPGDDDTPHPDIAVPL